MNFIISIQIIFSLLTGSCQLGVKESAKSTVASDSITQSDSKQQNECSNCSIENLVKLRLSENVPSLKDMTSYLVCCNSKCAQNVEYSQASNYSLFVFIQKYPSVVIDAMELNGDSLDISYISTMLQNPVSDDIDITKTIESLKSGTKDSKYKTDLLSSLDTALNKY